MQYVVSPVITSAYSLAAVNVFVPSQVDHLKSLVKYAEKKLKCWNQLKMEISIESSWTLGEEQRQQRQQQPCLIIENISQVTEPDGSTPSW